MPDWLDKAKEAAKKAAEEAKVLADKAKSADYGSMLDKGKAMAEEAAEEARKAAQTFSAKEDHGSKEVHTDENQNAALDENFAKETEHTPNDPATSSSVVDLNKESSPPPQPEVEEIDEEALVEKPILEQKPEEIPVKENMPERTNPADSYDYKECLQKLQQIEELLQEIKKML